MKSLVLVLALFVGQVSCASGSSQHSKVSIKSHNFPNHWWAPIPAEEKKSWEISPDEAKYGVELVLSKRNELGVFSNLGQAPFKMDGVEYQSVESLWQALKYPDPMDKKDPRHNISEYQLTREQVYQLSGFECKKAGDQANKIMKQHSIRWVSYQGNRFDYKDGDQGSAIHFEIIKEAIHQKVLQNPEIKELLLKTHPLKLLPDHKIRSTSPPSYYYNKILMDLRDLLIKAEK